MTLAAVVLAATAAIAQQPNTPPAPPQGGAPTAPPMHHSRSHRGGEGFDGGLDRSVGLSERPWWKSPMAAQEIGLTPDQVKRLDDISLQGELKLVRLRAEVEEGEIMLRATLDAPVIDEGKADQQIDKVAEARAAVEKAEAHLAVSLRGVLTPEQWTKMHEEHPMGPRGPMGPRPSGKRPTPPAKGQVPPPPAN